MELVNVVKGRRSIRKYLPKEVPQKLIAEILDEARWSPSWGNTQLWEFYVLTGKSLARFKEMTIQKSLAGEVQSRDVPMPENWPAAMKLRYVELGKVVLTSLGIKREDKESRDKYYMDMVSLFGAPCLILPCISKENLVEYGMLDIGLITQTICLLAHDKGLGTCLEAAVVRYPAAIKQIAAIPDNLRITVGIALGYPDNNSPLNNFERERSKIEEFVHWVD
jgi:nitroreductase